MYVGEHAKMEIQIAPRKSVFCLEKLPPKTLKLVPRSSNVSVVQEGAEPKHCPLISITGLKHPVSGKPLVGTVSAPKMNVPSADQYAADPESDKYDIVPHWLVQTTPDTGAVDVEIGVVTMNESTALKGASSDHATLTIGIPILTNSKTLQPGTELLQFKAQKRKDELEVPQPKVRKIEPKGRGKGKRAREQDVKRRG